jgi:hypothetical protein
MYSVVIVPLYIMQLPSKILKHEKILPLQKCGEKQEAILLIRFAITENI